MANWHPVTPLLGFQPIEDTETTQKHPLGTIIQARHDTHGIGEFIYLKGVASTAIGTWVTYNPDDFSTTRAVANAIGPVAIAMSANVASQYGWYQIGGKNPAGLCLANFADNGDVYLTATDGSVDDADVAGDYVSGAKGASARDTVTGAAEFELWRPFVRDGLDN